MKKRTKNKLKLLRTIVLETGEVIAANSLLETNDHFPLWTPVPSKKNLPSSKIEDYDILNLCSIPRQCIYVDSLTGMLEDMLVDGDNSIAPYSCTLNEFEQGVAIIEDPMHLPPHLTASYDNLLNPINIVEFCIFQDLLKGKFRNLSHSEEINAESYYTYCIVYHYAGCNELKVKSVKDAHFYKELISYQYQVEFDEINIGDEIECYVVENNKAFQMQHLWIVDKGNGPEWWESFKRSHSEICKKEADYKSFEDETHILARCEYYDKSCITGRKELVILHQSSYPHYLMTKTSKLKTLIEP